MRIDYHSVHFTTEEAFQLLHNQDLKLWEQVIDLLADAADDLYSRTPGAKLHDSVIENGIEFDEEGMYWSNEDIRLAKLEEVVG